MSIRQDGDLDGRGTSVTEQVHERNVAPVHDRDVEVVRETDRARGGVSMWSVLSGMLVAFGAFVILSAIVGAILAATGIAEGGIQPGEVAEASMGVGIGLLLAQFLSYLWGGYTAGRMARGSGTANGVLVPIVALVFVAILGTIIAAVTGAAAELDPSDVQQLPLPLSRLTDIGTAVGVGLLLTMLGGGALGGWLGARWHTKLENRAPSLGVRLRPVS